GRRAEHDLLRDRLGRAQPLPAGARQLVDGVRVGQRVAVRALQHAELPQVARQRRLVRVDALAGEQLGELRLAADRARRDQLRDRRVALSAARGCGARGHDYAESGAYLCRARLGASRPSCSGFLAVRPPRGPPSAAGARRYSARMRAPLPLLALVSVLTAADLTAQARWQPLAAPP